MIDRDRRTVTVSGKAIRPTKIEFLICLYLSGGKGFVRSRAQIMDACEISDDATEWAVDSHIKRLRNKGVTAIKTSWGVGFYWEDTNG